MFEFVNKIFKNKQMTEEKKLSIIELVKNEESFINPRDLIAEQCALKKAETKVVKESWISYVSPQVRMNDNLTGQLEATVEALFEILCTVADVELRKKRKNIKHVKYERYYYRVTIFDEIHRLAREVVFSFYRQDNMHPDIYFSYDLQAMLSRDIQKILIREVEEYRKYMSAPDEETRIKFGLTQFGTKIVWWDPSGILRENQDFDSTEMVYFDHLRKRVTRFTEAPSIMILCLQKYADLMRIVLYDLEDDSIKWKIKPNNYFRKYFQLPQDDGRIWAETFRLPTDLYILAENTVRREVEGLRVLPEEEYLQNLKQYLPDETFRKLQNCLNQKIDLELDYSTISALRSVNKTVWHEAANFFIRQSVEQVGSLLCEVAEDPDLKKVAAKVIKQSEEPDKRMLFICLMERMELPISKALQKERDGFIHPTRQDDYQQLLLDADLAFENLPGLLRECTQPLRREVKLDTALISASHAALDTIIDMVDTYLGEEETIEPYLVDKINLSSEVEVKQSESSAATIEESEVTATSELENEQDSGHLAFLKHLVASDGISLDDFKEQAKNNGKLHQAYLTELNEVLYEVFDDQVLVISQQQVIIEEDFMEEMREWLYG